MARVTVEDCILKIPNRFELVLLAAQRARDVASGAPITLERDNDKNPVVALREIADETIGLEQVKNSLIKGMQKHVEIDEPEEDKDLDVETQTWPVDQPPAEGEELAEEAVDELGRALQNPAPAWTAGAALPGGDIPQANFERFITQFKQQNAWLPADLAYRYGRAYGTRARHVIGEARSLEDLGRAFAPGLYEAELRYLREVEWARSAQDVLWRRSKLGLHVEPGTLESVTKDIDGWFAVSPAPVGLKQPFKQAAAGQHA